MEKAAAINFNKIKDDPKLNEYLIKYKAAIQNIVNLHLKTISLIHQMNEANLNSHKKLLLFKERQKKQIENITKGINYEVNDESFFKTNSLKFIAECTYNDSVLYQLLESDAIIDEKNGKFNFKNKLINALKLIRDFMKKYFFKIKNYIMEFINKSKLKRKGSIEVAGNKELLMEFSKKQDNIYKLKQYYSTFLFEAVNNNNANLSYWFRGMKFENDLSVFLNIEENIKKINYEEVEEKMIAKLVGFFSSLERGEAFTFFNSEKRSVDYSNVRSFDEFEKKLQEFIKIKNFGPSSEYKLIPYTKINSSLEMGIKNFERETTILKNLIDETNKTIGKFDTIIKRAEAQINSKTIDSSDIKNNIQSNINFASKTVSRLFKINNIISTDMARQYYGMQNELEKMETWKNIKDKEFLDFCDKMKNYKKGSE